MDRQVRSYKCLILNETVSLELEYTSIPNVEYRLKRFNCKNASVKCGVIKETGVPKYDWDVCPAYREVR